MNLMKTWSGMLTVACGVLLGTELALAQTSASNARSQTKDRARTVMSQPLPSLDGHHLKAVLLEVRYGPAEASTPHTHPCAVIGYVVEGSLRMQIQGQPETIYKAGQSFYEAPKVPHVVSANASTTEPAKFLAYFICDRDMPLTTDMPQVSSPKGASK